MPEKTASTTVETYHVVGHRKFTDLDEAYDYAAFQPSREELLSMLHLVKPHTPRCLLINYKDLKDLVFDGLKNPTKGVKNIVEYTESFTA